MHLLDDGALLQERFVGKVVAVVLRVVDRLERGVFLGIVQGAGDLVPLAVAGDPGEIFGVGKELGQIVGTVGTIGIIGGLTEGIFGGIIVHIVGRQWDLLFEAADGFLCPACGGGRGSVQRERALYTGNMRYIYCLL